MTKIIFDKEFRKDQKQSIAEGNPCSMVAFKVETPSGSSLLAENLLPAKQADELAGFLVHVLLGGLEPHEAFDRVWNGTDHDSYSRTNI